MERITTMATSADNKIGEQMRQTNILDNYDFREYASHLERRKQQRESISKESLAEDNRMFERFYFKVMEARSSVIHADENTQIEVADLQDYLEDQIEHLYRMQLQSNTQCTPGEFLEIALRYGEFCKVSGRKLKPALIEDLIQKCPNSDQAYILAYEWCSKLNPPAAEPYLRKGLETLPSSVLLHIELFKHCLSEEWTFYEKAHVAYYETMETLEGADLREFLVQVNNEILRKNDKLPNQELSDMAMNDLLERFSLCPEAYTIAPKRSLLNLDLRNMPTEEIIATAQSSIAHFKKGAQQTNEKETLFKYYLDFVIQDLSKVLLPKDLRPFWTDAINEAIEYNKLSEAQCQEYLKAETSRERGELNIHLGNIFDYATNVYPKNTWFWQKYMDWAKRTRNEPLMDQIFTQANKNVLEGGLLADVVIYWKEYYMNVKLRWCPKRMWDEYFNIGLKGRSDLAREIQLLYVEYIFNSGDRNEYFRLFTDDPGVPNPCSEFFMKLAEIESCKVEPNVEQIRNLHAKAKINNFEEVAVVEIE